MAQVAPIGAFESKIRSIQQMTSLDRTRTNSSLKLHLSVYTVRWLWVAILTTHALCASVLIILMLVFRLLAQPEMVYYVLFLNNVLPDLDLYALPFGLIAAYHINAFVGAHVLSYRKKQPTFAPVTWLAAVLFDGCRKRKRRRSDKVDAIHSASRMAMISSSRTVQVTVGVAQQVQWFVEHVFGIDSPYFLTIHILREAVEVIAQINQAYHASVLVSHRYINHLLVVMLVVNCWSTPAIHYAMRMHGPQTDRSRAQARATCLVVDAILNAMSCTVVPMVLLVPFWRAFDWTIGDFPIELMYDDVFYARLATEIQMIATGTTMSLLIRMIPHISICLTLAVVSEMIELQSSEISSTRKSKPIVKILVSTAQQKEHELRSTAPLPKQQPSRPTLHYIRGSVQVAFALTGLAILAIHVATNTNADRFARDAHCRLVVAPWFSTSKYPCMVYTYDCQDMNDTTARKGQLDFLDERALLTLNFAHCSELVVPSDIQHFPNLLGMNLKHLTLADWPMDAAVTADYFPNMLFLVFSHVNWSCLPDGILGPLPNGLQDIELTHTNLSVIPDGLDQHWPGVGTLFIEYSQIQHVPSSLLGIALFDLSLIGNDIEDASVLASLPPSISRVSLDHNPLRVLPVFNESSGVFILIFSAEHTLVRDVPPRYKSNVDGLFLQESPYCSSVSEAVAPAVCDVGYNRADGKCLLN